MTWQIITADARQIPLADQSVQCVVTSPPYWGLRDYGVAGQIGLEKTPEDFVDSIVSVFREVRRVLRDDGTIWVNLGDSYATGAGKVGEHPGGGAQGARWRGDHAVDPKRNGASIPVGPMNQPNRMPIIGLKPKDLVGIPWMIAFALQADGWYLRSDIIWSKPNPMPESVRGSHFTRHMVTIEEYERLSGLRYFDECAGADWAGDMPGLSEIEVFSDQAPLSAKSQGASHCPSPRNAGRCAREAAAVQPIVVRSAKPSEIRSNGEGEGHASQDHSEVQGQFAWESCRSVEASANQESSKKKIAAPPSEREIQARAERESLEPPPECATSWRDSFNGEAANSDRLGGDSQSGERSLLLLQEETTVDHRSRNPAQQGRTAHEVERSSSLHTLQFREEGQNDSPLLVGCPGCHKCIRHHGYIFHYSAGRPTKAHEYIFLLSKQERYFFDQDAVREKSITHDPRRPYTSQGAWAMDGRPEEQRHGGEPRNGFTRVGKEGVNSRMYQDRDPKHSNVRKVRSPAGWKTGPGSHGSVHEDGREQKVQYVEDVFTTRNIRTVWEIATQPFSEAHFATFPQELAERCIKAGSKPGDIVLDPFAGAGTTPLVADKLNRRGIGLELKGDYCRMAHRRCFNDAPLLAL